MTENNSGKENNDRSENVPAKPVSNDRSNATSEQTVTASLDAPDPAKAKNQLWWQIAALLLVSALAVYTGKAFDEEWKKFAPEARQLASSYNQNATGLKAMYKLAEQQGKPVSTWERPYRNLRDAKGLLLLVAPIESLRPFQAEQILEWVKQGNDLVYIDDFSFAMTDQMARRLGVRVKPHKSLTAKVVDQDYKPVGNFAELAHVQKLRLASSVRLLGGEPLVADDDGAILTVVPFGKGRVLLGSCPTILANNTVAKKEYWGNFQLVTNWFKTAGDTIYFDEYCHGYTGGTNVFVYLAQGPTGLVVAQIFAILIIGVLSESQRFGSARSIASRRRISNLEFINGLSHAYRRARANPAVLEILFHSFKNRLSRALGISPHEPTERLKEAWQQSKFQTSFNLDSLLAQYEEFMTRRAVSDAELKTMLDTCDKITETTQETSAARSITSSKS